MKKAIIISLSLFFFFKVKAQVVRIGVYRDGGTIAIIYKSEINNEQNTIIISPFRYHVKKRRFLKGKRDWFCVDEKGPLITDKKFKRKVYEECKEWGEHTKFADETAKKYYREYIISEIRKSF